MNRTRLIGLGVMVGLVAASCGKDRGPRSFASSPPVVLVERLDRGSSSLVTVRGALVAGSASGRRLCAALAESYPPQCGGASIAVRVLDATRVAATKTNSDAPPNQRVIWTDTPIALVGRVVAGELVLVGDSLGDAEPGVLVIADAGPTCPVERVPPDPACASRPVAGATVELWSSTGSVASTVTDAVGVAVFSVAAGNYDVVPLPAAGLMGTPSRQTVRVTSGTSKVSLSYDTGIR